MYNTKIFQIITDKVKLSYSSHIHFESHFDNILRNAVVIANVCFPWMRHVKQSPEKKKIVISFIKNK